MEVGFSQVYKTTDWLKPKGVANWKSKVDFEIIARLNPKAGDPKVELVKSAEVEVRNMLHQDALLAKARSEYRTGKSDPINDGGGS